MACTKPKCRNKSEDPLISCWVCDSIFHGKCVELAPRTVDNLREGKGLRWCCKKCMDYDVEFFAFFRNSRNKLDEINNDLKCLTKKFLDYKEILETSLRSPKRKKKTIAVNSPSPNGNNTDNIDPNDVDKGLNIAPSTSSYSILANTNLSVLQHQNLQLPQALTPNMPPNNHVLTPSMPPNNQVPTRALYADVPDFMPGSNPPMLKVISPKKTIFAARFASETTTDAVVHYIKHKIGNDIDVTVFKFKYTERRSKCSFKIIVPEENFQTIVNTDFWPPNAIIHEYVYNNNNNRSDIVYLPSQNTASKN